MGEEEGNMKTTNYKKEYPEFSAYVGMQWRLETLLRLQISPSLEEKSFRP